MASHSILTDGGKLPNARLDESTGVLSFQSSGQVYKDVFIHGTSLGAGASAPDMINFFAAGGIQGRGFDGNITLEQLYGSFEVQHDYAEGTDVIFHVHWMPTTNNAGNVKWFLEYSWVNADGVFSNPTTISVIQAAGGTAWTHKLASWDAVVGTGKLIGSVMAFRLYRNPADADDTYPNDAALLDIGCHYLTDTLGSRGILTK